MLALTLVLLSARITAGLYKSPAEFPGWKTSSHSSVIPEEATAVQEYATPNKNATIEEITLQDEAFLDNGISEMIEHPGELSPTILAQNARASRIAIRQGKAARGSAAGSSMFRSERVQYLNKLPASNNAQNTIENTSSVSGIRGMAARRSGAGGFIPLSERVQYLNKLPASNNAQDTIENASSTSGIRGMAAHRSDAGRSGTGGFMPLSERLKSLNKFPPSSNSQDTIGNASSMSGIRGMAVRRPAGRFAAGGSMVLPDGCPECDEFTNAQDTVENTSSLSGIRGKAVRRSAAGKFAAGGSMVLSERDEFPNELSSSTNAHEAVRNAVRRSAAGRFAAGSSMVLSERDEFLNELPPSTNVQDTIENASSMSGVRGKAGHRSAAGSSTILSDRVEFPNELPSSTNAHEAVGNASSMSGVRGKAARRPAPDPALLGPDGSYGSRGYFGGNVVEVVQHTSGYNGPPRVMKVMPTDEEGNRIMPMTEPPRATMQSVEIQKLYPQLLAMEPDCDEKTKRIFEIPETRQLDLVKDQVFALDDITYAYDTWRLDAALGQIRGVVAHKPCGHCKNKTTKGPFATCVVVPGEFDGACCNCIYKYPVGLDRDRACTPKAQIKAEAKAKHPLRAASLALRSHFPKLRSIKSLPTEHLKEANTQSAAASQRQAERMWAAYPRGF
jgi:hypothetical protein